jgi:hypothetical protein
MALRKRRPGLVYPVGEDWHYVGDTGEPAFNAAWTNNQSDYNLAFRLRETGVVDVQGIIAAVADPPGSATIFTLPTGYRPSGNTSYMAGGVTTGTKYVSVEISVGTNGLVSVQDGAADPFPVPGNSDALAGVTLSLQVFLLPAVAP